MFIDLDEEKELAEELAYLSNLSVEEFLSELIKAEIRRVYQLEKKVISLRPGRREGVKND